MNIRLVIAALALARTAPLAAQRQMVQDTRGDTLDLRRAVALARANNPTLAARAADVRAAGARIGPAGALPDPMLTLGAMNYMLPSLSARGDPLTMNQISLTQTLPVNGTLGLRRAVARADSTRVDLLRVAAVLDVERGVRAAYWRVYHNDRALEIMTRRRAVLQEIAAVARTMYATGSSPQSDVLRAQVALTQLDQEVAEMQLERYAAASELNAMLGRPGESSVILPSAPNHETHGAAMLAMEMPAPPPLDTLIAWANERNPDLLAGDASVDGSRSNAAAARRAIIPDLGLGVAYGQRVGSNDMLSLMVSVNLPIWSGARQSRRRDEANAMTDAATQELTAARVRVRSALGTARAEAETARRLVELYARTLVLQADAAYQGALSGYRVGRVDFTTLLDAQTALLTYEHDLHRYEAMYGTALAELDRLTGRTFDAGLAAGMEN
jgi:cobalt-zinc-cadmium efflux system outer membrane protein